MNTRYTFLLSLGVFMLLPDRTSFAGEETLQTAESSVSTVVPSPGAGERIPQTGQDIISEQFVSALESSLAVKTMVTSPDSKRVAYFVEPQFNKQQGYGVTVEDAKERPVGGKSGDLIQWVYYDGWQAYLGGSLKFTPDSKRVAFAAIRGGKAFVVVEQDRVDGTYHAARMESIPESFRAIGGTYDGIAGDGPVFSQDGKRIGFVARIGQKRFAVVDGKQGKPYDAVSPPVFSTDGQHVAYAASVEKKWFMVIDDKEGNQYDGMGHPHFSPDGKKAAYLALMGNEQNVVVQGQERRQIDSVFSPTFSPDGGHFAYVKVLGNRQCVVVDDKRQKEYEGIAESSIVFSPDGKRVAFVARKGDHWCIVVDGIDGKDYSSCAIPTFSPDSQRVVHAATEGQRYFMVIDGQEQKQSTALALGYAFSPDSKRFAYSRKAEDNKWSVIVDGKESKKYDAVIGKIIFDSPNTLHYLATRTGVVYLVSQTIR